ncbi:hypothetical protein NBRC116493_11540 [Aurantivibrio infirmus]
MVFKRYGGGFSGGNSANTRFIEVRAFSLWLAFLIGAAGGLLDNNGILIVLLMVTFPLYYGLGVLAEKKSRLAFFSIIFFSFLLIVFLSANSNRIIEAEYLESRISIHFFIVYCLLMAITATFCIVRLKHSSKAIAENNMYRMFMVGLLSTVAILVITALNTTPVLTWDKTLELSERLSSGEYEAFLETLELVEENLFSATKTEDLAWISGKYAPIDPEKYLMALRDWRKDNPTAQRFGCFGITNFGEWYVDKVDAQLEGIGYRKSKIESIDAEKLESIKALCLDQLSDVENTLTEIISTQKIN